MRKLPMPWPHQSSEAELRPMQRVSMLTVQKTCALRRAGNYSSRGLVQSRSFDWGVVGESEQEMLGCTVKVNGGVRTNRSSARADLQSQRLTTLVSSLRNCRRYLAISCAIPLGSLMFFWRRSFRTLRKPSFHCCFSSWVLPGFAVPSWTRSFSPIRKKSVCVQGAGRNKRD